MSKDKTQLLIRIPKDLHREVKIRAAQEGRPLSEVIREMLEEWTRTKEPQK